MNKNGENVAAAVMLEPGSMNKEAVTGGLLSHLSFQQGLSGESLLGGSEG